MKTIRKRVLSLFTAIVMICSLVVCLPSTDIHVSADNTPDSLVAIAEGEIGNGYYKYTSWFGSIGSTYQYAWCATFVSWCMQQAGCEGVVSSARCTVLYNNSTCEKHYVQDGAENYAPRRGDIIFFDWDTDAVGFDHVAIVYDYNASTNVVSFIDGNGGSGTTTTRKVRRSSINRSSHNVQAFMRPNYGSSICTCSESYAGTYEVTTSQYPLTIRSGHGTGYSKIGEIPKGAHCTVTKADGSWAHVVYNGISGYASMDYLKKVNVNHDPKGVVDRIEGGAGKVNVYGWTFDPDNSSKSLEIHVYIGGPAGSANAISAHGGIMANAESSDVNNAYGISGTHRFNAWIETSARGEQPVYVYAINSEGGNNPCIGSGTVNITEPIPQGSEMSSGAGQTIPDGDYIIISELGRNIYLDIPEVAYPAPEGIDVTICNASTLPGKNDLFDTWTVKYLDNGYYKIIQNEKCGKEVSLDVKNDSKAVGADIMTHYYHGGHNQQWSISETSHGYRIQSRSTSWYLDVRDAGTATGTKVQMCQAIAGDKAQAWGFIPVASDDRPIADGEYSIKSKLANVWLDVWGNYDVEPYKNGTNIGICDAITDTFDVKYIGDGYYKILEHNSGLALDVDKPSYLNRGGNVQLYENGSDDKANQLWRIKDMGNGYYCLISKMSGYCIDIAGAVVDNSTNVQQYTFNNHDAQKWSFEPVDSTKPVITDVQVTDVSSTGYTVTCKVTDEGGSGLDRVQFPTWTTNDGQDDIQSSWETNSAASGKINGDTVTFRVNVSDHGNEHGFYRTHIYAYDKHNNYKTYVIDDINVPHKYKEETIPETCTDPGIKTYTCDCGDTYTEEIPALGHDFSSKWTIDVWPTATTTGNKSHHCTRCNEKTDVTEIPATGISNPSVKYIPNVNSINLSWNDVIGAEQYAICGYTNGKWQILAKTDGTSYTLNKLKAETEYKITVIAMFDGEWNKDFSNEITVTPKAEIISLYPAVQTQVKDGKIGFKWTKVPGAEKYGIGIYQANKWKVIKQLDGSISTWTSPQVRNGTYRLVVLAKVDGQWVNADVFKKSFYVTVS